MKKHYLSFSAFIFAILIITGCSSGSSNSIDVSMPFCNDDALIANSDYESCEFPALFGAYSLNISPDLQNVELIPLRLSAIGESWLVNGMMYFTVTPCSTCLKIESIALDSGNVKLTFSITHPFKPGNTSEPPSGINRLDLNIFDVAMIIVPSDIIPTTYSLGQIYTTACANQAGFTRELANLIGNPAACPCFLVVDDSMTGTSTYNKFAMGTTNKLFDVWFSDIGTYKLYLTMGYGASAKKAQRLNPKYYNPEFNRKSAWRVDVTPPEGVDPPALGNTWDDADTTTEYFVTVDVYDWQIGATVNTSMLNTTDIYAASDVASVSVEIPGMTASPVIVTSSVSGTGKPNDPLVFSVPVANANGLPPGEYTALVKVLDERIPPNPYTDRDYLIDFVLPTELVNVAPPSWTFAADDVSAKSPYAYATAESGGFRIINISNPLAAYEVSSLSMTGPTCVDASGNYAYVCDASSLSIIDVSTPSSPLIIKQVPSLNSPRDISVVNGYAYVATQGGVVIIDIDLPASASVIKGVSTNGTPIRLSVANGYVYMTTGMGSSAFLEIVCVDPPLDAYWVSVTNLMLPSGHATGICVANYYAYITVRRSLVGDQDFLLIVDIDPPETPYTMKMVDLYELGECVDVVGGLAYVGSYHLIHIVDVSKVSSAHLIATISTPGFNNDIDAESGYLYVANDTKGLMIYPQYIPPSGGLMNYVIPEYATYQIFTATVVDG